MGTRDESLVKQPSQRSSRAVMGTGSAWPAMIGLLALAAALIPAVYYRASLWENSRWLTVVGAASGLAGLCLAMLVWSGQRRRQFERLWRSLAENLEKLAHAEETRAAIGRLGPLPAGSSAAGVAQGWNRLLGYLERLQSDIETTYAEKHIGHLLNSFEAQQLMMIFEALPVGVMLVNTDGKIVLANRTCEGMLGLPVSRLIECDVTAIYDLPEGHTLIQQLRDGEGIQGENYFDIRLKAVPVPGDSSGESDGNGLSLIPMATETQEDTVLRITGHRCGQQAGPGNVSLMIRDITQQKLSESARDGFIAHVSHELRSPLSNIRAYTESLLSNMMLDATAQKEAFNVINEETIRLTRLVNEVLDLSRMEAGTLVLEKGEVVMERLIRQCINDLKAMAAQKSITLQTNYHPKFPNLHADRDKLAVVINNIVSNAIKYTPENGTVFVETGVEERFVTIKVTDTGYGIAPEDIDKIFDKFYRVSRAETSKIPGTGLGLATCKEIVTLHGGTIDVESELNKGSTMIIKLPLTRTGPVLGPAAAES